MLLLLLLVATTLLASSEDQSKNSNFEYYDLALQRCSRDASWTIHGLWPEYNVTKWPQFCNKTEYSEFKPSELEKWVRFNEMNKYWYSCETGNPMTFWKHEWQKHGTCTNLNITEYFGKALDLFHGGTLGALQPLQPLQCCKSNWMQCLLKFDKLFKWKGTCHTISDSSDPGLSK